MWRFFLFQKIRKKMSEYCDPNSQPKNEFFFFFSESNTQDWPSKQHNCLWINEFVMNVWTSCLKTALHYLWIRTLAYFFGQYIVQSIICAGVWMLQERGSFLFAFFLWWTGDLSRVWRTTTTTTALCHPESAGTGPSWPWVKVRH